ncbi:MAG TPA: tetratricopeptide repeat protein, partial [Gammaproteobacteria bacterium]|nr:tetratricopeptide repeat protein [Gammaproteobacteria bacterium]
MKTRSLKVLAVVGVACAVLVTGCAGVKLQDGVAAPIFSETPVDPAVGRRADLMFQLLAGEIAGKRGDVDEAMLHYSEASKLSDSPDVAARAARIASFAKDYEVALASAQRWLSLEPDSEEAQQAVGLLLVRMGRPKEALEHFKKVIDKDGEKNYEVSFARLSLTFGRESVSDDELEAMNLLRKAYPDVVYAQRAYAELAYRKDQYGSALAALDDALRLDPKDQPSHILKNRVLLASGKVDAALQGMKKLLLESPDDPELRHGYARMLVQAKRYEQALSEYEKITRMNPDDLDVVYSTALLEIELKHYDDARSNLKKLLDSPHHNNEAYYYLGRIEEEQKIYDQAISWFARIHRGEYFL